MRLCCVVMCCVRDAAEHTDGRAASVQTLSRPQSRAAKTTHAHGEEGRPSSPAVILIKERHVLIHPGLLKEDLPVLAALFQVLHEACDVYRLLRCTAPSGGVRGGTESSSNQSMPTTGAAITAHLNPFTVLACENNFALTGTRASPLPERLTRMMRAHPVRARVLRPVELHSEHARKHRVRFGEQAALHLPHQAIELLRVCLLNRGERRPPEGDARELVVRLVEGEQVGFELVMLDQGRETGGDAGGDGLLCHGCVIRF